jgi:pyruvate dehydrogenase E2 component (dihydrolipoamide acetyltransferase)
MNVAPAPSGLGPRGVVTRLEPTRSERTLARRSAETRATVPSVEFATTVDMERSLATEAELGCGIAALLVKAAANALAAVPRVNGAYRDGHYELHSRFNIGVVVAEEGLYVIPTVFDADSKSAAEIAVELRDGRARALADELRPADLAGATFTLATPDPNPSRPGSDVAALTPLIVPPQAAALAAGPVREAPVVRDGRVVPGHTMAATLAADHRIVYGVLASSFLGEFKAYLEEGRHE